MKYISLSVFIISFLIGVLYMYLSKPELKIIKVSPNPENINDNIYKDKANNCFKYESEEVPCGSDNSFFSIQN